jgi:hypothetical protein
LTDHAEEVVPFERLVLAHQARMIEREKREWHIQDERLWPFEERGINAKADSKSY